MKVFRSFTAAFRVALLSACGTGSAEFNPKRDGAMPVIVVTPTPNPTPTRSPSPLTAYEASIYHLASFVDGSGVNISGGAEKDDAALIQYPFDEGFNEDWMFVEREPNAGNYAIMSVVDAKCITPKAALVEPGAVLVIEACDTNDKQLSWQATQNGNAMIFKHVTSQLCMTVQNASPDAGAPLVLEACNGEAAQMWRIESPVSKVAYGDVEFLAAPTNSIVAFAADMIVPPEPPATGTLFLWPGLQAQATSPSYEPFGLGVLQPVLSWGPSCAPTPRPPNYSQWYISGMYVGTFGTADTSTCEGGNVMLVSPGDLLHIEMVLNGNAWTQTIRDATTQQSVNFTYDLVGQLQTQLLFVIEEYHAKPVSDVTFEHISWSVAQPDVMFCVPWKQGLTDWLTTPVLSVDKRTCTVDKVILRADGVAATSPNL